MEQVYIADKEYNKANFKETPLKKGEYENCIFRDCEFSETDLSDFIFTDCVFDRCNISVVKMNKASFRDSIFQHCKMLGLHFVDCWQTYSSILPGYAASGATLTIFQLGGETIPDGAVLSPSPAVVAPLIWSTGSPQTSRRCRTSIDFSSAGILEGKETIQQAGDRLHQTLMDIASGTLTRCEPLAYVPPVMPYMLDVPF